MVIKVPNSEIMLIIVDKLVHLEAKQLTIQEEIDELKKEIEKLKKE